MEGLRVCMCTTHTNVNVGHSRMLNRLVRGRLAQVCEHIRSTAETRVQSYVIFNYRDAVQLDAGPK